MYHTLDEAMAAFAADRAMHVANGALALDSVKSYLTEEMKRDFHIALDAQPTLQTDPNSGIPVFLTTMIDPQVYKVLYSANKGADILGEQKKGTWLDTTAMFPITENTAETSAYGDFDENGLTSVNVNFPQRQSFLFQIIKQYGEKEMEQAGLGKVNWVSELDASAALGLNKFANFTYFFGVAGLQNYGLVNDPGLSAPIAPSLKAYGGNAWISGGVVVATANEIFADIQSLFIVLVNQSNGLIDAESKVVIAMSPQSAIALTATNSFDVNVRDLLKENFPNIRFETAVQYGALSAVNPQGQAGGNYVQMIAEDVEGQKAGYCAFNEKMRSHKIIAGLSSWKQKVTAGTWGAIIRQPMAFAGMQGV